MTTLDFVRLTSLMDMTRGSSALSIGLVDGPVAQDSPDLDGSVIRTIPDTATVGCQRPASVACRHGSCIAAMLVARGDGVLAICPECPLLVRPIFGESPAYGTESPSAEPGELALSILDCIQAGVRVINLSLTVVPASLKAEQILQEALDQAVRRGVIVVAAAGNQNMAGSTVITRHPWVIPVMACDLQGRPAAYSNFGRSIGSRGLSAPGETSGTSIGPCSAGDLQGTSIATPYVTGAIALLWSIFPKASAQQVRVAVTNAGSRRASVVSPVLDARAAYQAMVTTSAGRLM